MSKFKFKVGDLVDISENSVEASRIKKIEGNFPQRVTSTRGYYIRFNNKESGWYARDFVEVGVSGAIGSNSPNAKADSQAIFLGPNLPTGPKPPTGAQGLKGGLGCKGLGKYDREIIGLDGTRVIVDVYRVLDAFSTQNPILDHLIKKALCAGLRGHKDRGQDLRDILHSAQKAIELFEQKEGK